MCCSIEIQYWKIEITFCNINPLVQTHRDIADFWRNESGDGKQFIKEILGKGVQCALCT